MGESLEDAVKRLDGALNQLEGAIARRLEAERRKGDLETELQIMQDDRARLAVELDAALARLDRYAATVEDVEGRVKRAMAAIETAVADSDGA